MLALDRGWSRWHTHRKEGRKEGKKEGRNTISGILTEHVKLNPPHILTTQGRVGPREPYTTMAALALRTCLSRTCLDMTSAGARLCAKKSRRIALRGCKCNGNQNFRVLILECIIIIIVDSSAVRCVGVVFELC